MKKILSLLILSGMLVSMTACRDESLNPLPQWEYAVHGLLQFDGVAAADVQADYANSFPLKAQDAAKVPFKVRWVSLDNKLTVIKIDIYVRMLESYNDPEGNPKTADLSGNGKGRLYTTIAAPAGNRQWNSFTIVPSKVYDIYKNATVKYDKVNAVNVFANQSPPAPEGALFKGVKIAK